MRRELAIVSIEAYCGQYLPDWRPGADYRLGYAADQKCGGGVLRDLSHELDCLLELGGRWRRVVALGGHLSSRDINSDCWSIPLEMERCPAASLQINYLGRPGRRQIVVKTRHTYCADLIRNSLARDTEEEVFRLHRDDTYIAEHLAMLAGDGSQLCSLEEGLRVMQLIAAIESSAKKWVWIHA